MLTTLRPTTNLVQMSIVCFFTREFVLDRWLQCFDALEFPIPQTWIELVFIIDVEDDEIYRRLLAHFQGKPFNGVHIYRSEQKAANVTSMDRRRDRICEIHEISKDLISNRSKYVFGLEDDTIFPPDALNKFYAAMEADSNVGYIEGIQCGRHRVKMIGAWRMDNLDDPTYMATVPWLPDGGIVEIDGGGFYCYLTRTDLYKAATYRWEFQCFGPDVCYGWDLKRQGRKILLDYSVVCDHFTEQGIIRPNDYIVVAEFDQTLQEGFPEFWPMRSVTFITEEAIHE